jgi:E1-E2 ATPase
MTVPGWDWYLGSMVAIIGLNFLRGVSWCLAHLRLVQSSNDTSIEGYREDVLGRLLNLLMRLYLLGVNVVIGVVCLSSYYYDWYLYETYVLSDVFVSVWSGVAIITGIWQGVLIYCPMFYRYPVILQDAENVYFRKHKVSCPVQIMSDGVTRIVQFRLDRYILDQTLGEFKKVSFWSDSDTVSLSEIKSTMETGLYESDVETRRCLVGKNSTQYNLESFYSVFMRDHMVGFTAFQLLFIWAQAYWQYIEYTVVVLSITMMTNLYSVYTYQKRHKKLKDMCESDGMGAKCQVLRDRQWSKVDSMELVPGDIVKLEAGEILSFDGILIQRNTTADEAVLTGDSVPVKKEPISLGSVVDMKWSRMENNVNFVLAGTSLAHTGNPRIALVAYTGWQGRQ